MRLRLIVESAQLGTFDFNPRTRELSWSDQTRQHFGLAPGSPVDYSIFLSGIHPDDRQRVDHAIQEALRPGNDGRFACEYRTVGIHDGRLRWISAWGQVLFDKDGQAIRFVGATRDVTDRRQTQQRVQDREEQLRRVVESAPNAMVMTDEKGRIVLVNAQTESLFGYTREELIGQSIEVLVPQRFRGKHPEYRRGFMANPQARPMGAGRDLFGLHKDGHEIPVEIGLNPVNTEEGMIVIAGIVDITERKRTEQTLRRQVDLLEQTYDAIFVWEFDGPIVYWNRGAEQLYGYSRHEAVDREPRDLLKTRLSRGSKDFREALLQSGQWNGELYHHTADGRQVVVESRLVLMHYGAGRPYVLETTRDITQRKRAEWQLKTLNDTLEKRVAKRTAQLRALAGELSQAEQRERHRLARILHDELQQLLVGAKFNVDIVRSQTDDIQLRQMLGQIDDVLDESLKVSRSLTVELSPPILYQGNMSQAMQWLARWMQEKHGLAVDVEADENANPEAEEVRILLFQAVRELLFNVVKHANIKRAQLSLTQPDPDNLQIVIRDGGTGFDPHHSRKLRQHGSGFGLLSIQERISWMGGHMTIDSAPGRGARVTLLAPTRLHLSVDQDVPETVSHKDSTSTDADSNPAPNPPSERKIRVLLADDHAVVRDGLARLLQMQPGIEVVGQASDGRQAVEMALQLRPDVILMDVSMPVLSGMEATRQIHHQLPRVLIIGLSMHSEQDVAAAMSAAGASAYLTKTSPPELLIKTIRTCVMAAG